MEAQRISIKHQRTLSSIGSLLLLGCALLTSGAQAAVPVSDSLLPPTTTDMLQQSVQQPSALTEQKENQPLSQSEIVDQATSQSADAHIITKNKDGSVRIPSPMQDVIATLTAKGARIYSDDEAGETFALLVNGLGRENKLTKLKPGKISHDENIARLVHNNLIEEFSTSSEGIRQDFVIPSAPKGKGKLFVELNIEGASVIKDKKGALLTLKSGRELAYHNLMVADASGQTLPAYFTVKNKNTLHIVVDDHGAQYPVRIDPTITDADWFSMGIATPSINGSIWALASDDAGNLYVGGQFSDITGIANSAYLVMWDGGNWSALGSGVNDTVKALVWNGSTLYAGGLFTTAGRVSANSIAKWDGNNWNALGAGINGSSPYVDALIWDGANLYAGGKFTSAGGLTANHVARWDGNNWYTLGSGMSSSTSTAVYALAWDGTNLYASGTFTNAGGVAANHVAKWDGSAWSALGSGTNNWVSELVWDGSSLYAAGAFTSAGGKTANRIASWDGNAWSALSSGLNNTVEALLWDGNNIYAGGYFSTAGGISASRIARWNGSDWSALVAGMNGTVRATAWDGTGLYIGGAFTHTGGVVSNHIARWNGNVWSALNSGMNGNVNALVWDGANLYAGGAFTRAGGVAANRIAQWDGSTWYALSSGVDHTVNALVWDGSNLYSGGTSFNTGGILSNNIASWNGSFWNNLGSNMNSSIRALAWDGTNLYAGGAFTNADGVAANHIAKWNGSNWRALGTGINGTVFALNWSANSLYAGGVFTTAGGANASNIAQWNGNNWGPLGSGSPNAVIYALTSDGRNLYAGGSFTFAGNVANHVAKWDGSNWSNLGSGTNDSVFALTRGGSNLYTGGDFTTAGGKDAGYVAGVSINLMTLNPLTFTDITDAALNTLVTSEILNITGINIAVDISITGGEYSLNGSAFTSIAGTANNGDTLQLHATSSANYNTITNTVVTVDSISDTWSATTLTDTAPDTFTFTDQTDVAQSIQITSNIVTITGLDASTVISIAGGEYSINGGPYSARSGFVNNTDTVTVRTTSASNFNAAVNVAVYIGGIRDIFTVTTEAGTDSGENTEVSGSSDPTLLGLFSLFIISLRRRAKL